MSCKVITIAQQKGGAGKTTIAAHLAVVLSQKGNKVAVLDIDPQGSLTAWHNLREQKFGQGYTGINFNNISGWRASSEINSLKRSFDYIIVDSPPHVETDAKAAIRAADLVLIPIQPSPTDLWATKATLDLAKKESIPAFVVLNRVTPNSKLTQVILKELDSVLKTQIGSRVAFASCLLEGKCVSEIQPSSSAALEIKALTEEVVKLLKPKAEKKTKNGKVKKVSNL